MILMNIEIFREGRKSKPYGFRVLQDGKVAYTGQNCATKSEVLEAAADWFGDASIAAARLEQHNGQAA